VTPKVKICGLTRPEDVEQLCGMEIDFLGFVFYPPSARFVPPEKARLFVTMMRELSPMCTPVAVLVNPSLSDVLKLHETTLIEMFQLHGDESPALVCDLQQRGFKVIKAVRIGKTQVVPRWQEYKPDYFLCDTLRDNAPGGTGHSWDIAWLPKDFPVKCSFLAGGITPENVLHFLSALRPFGIDVSSGVEISPGIKDVAKVADLLRTIRSYNPSVEERK